jgi:hypothetical protein
MQKVFSKYPDLVCSILEYSDKKSVRDREQFYIDHLKPNLNINPLASVPPSRKGMTFSFSEEVKENMKRAAQERGARQREETYQRLLPLFELFNTYKGSMRKFCKEHKLGRVNFLYSYKRWKDECEKDKSGAGTQKVDE